MFSCAFGCSKSSEKSQEELAVKASWKYLGRFCDVFDVSCFTSHTLIPGLRRGAYRDISGIIVEMIQMPGTPVYKHILSVDPFA